MIVAIMKQINYNRCADLSRGTHLGILECMAKGPSSMGAQFQLGKSPFIPESRQAENPCMSVHNFWGFFTSAVLRRNNSAQVGVTDRVKAIQHLQGMWYREPICTGRESNKGYICSYGIA